MSLIGDIEWINARSPYRVRAVNDSAFRFNTKHSLEYELSFVHMLDIGSHSLFYSYLVLIDEKDGKRPADPDLALTFAPIIHRFLIDNPDSLVMFCHSGDGGSYLYQRIFLSWAGKYRTAFGFDGGGYITAAGKDAGGDPYHFCIFHSGTCSEIDALKEFIVASADDIISAFIQQRTEVYAKLRELGQASGQ